MEWTRRAGRKIMKYFENGSPPSTTFKRFLNELKKNIFPTFIFFLTLCLFQYVWTAIYYVRLFAQTNNIKNHRLGEELEEKKRKVN